MANGVITGHEIQSETDTGYFKEIADGEGGSYFEGGSGRFKIINVQDDNVLDKSKEYYESVQNTAWQV